MAEEAKLILTSSLSENHWRTAAAANAEGAALEGLQQYQKAELLLVDSYEILRTDAGAIPLFVTQAKRRLAELYEAWGKPDEARKYAATSTEADVGSD